MKNLLLIVAVACVGLVLTSPAQAQSFSVGIGYTSGPGYRGGFSGYPAVVPGYGGFGQGGFGQGGFGHSGHNHGGHGHAPSHVDVIPGGFVPHRGHYHYVQPHADYHIGRRSYEVVPTPYGSVVSPYPHQHGHR